MSARRKPPADSDRSIAPATETGRRRRSREAALRQWPKRADAAHGALILSEGFNQRSIEMKIATIQRGVARPPRERRGNECGL